MPDISANADPLTGYAEYCTGSSYISPNPTGTDYESACDATPQTPGAPGWFHIGGTSLSAPLFGALFGDRDAYQGHRSGTPNLSMRSLTSSDPGCRFPRDLGVSDGSTNNGFYPVTPDYNEATGIGSPNFTGLITGPAAG